MRRLRGSDSFEEGELGRQEGSECRMSRGDSGAGGVGRGEGVSLGWCGECKKWKGVGEESKRGKEEGVHKMGREEGVHKMGREAEEEEVFLLVQVLVCKLGMVVVEVA